MLQPTSMTRITEPTGPRRPGRPSVGDDPLLAAVAGHVGNRMKLRRTLLGLSQAQLGDRMGGLAFQQIQKYERGANQMNTARLIQASRALDVPISFFFDDLSPALHRAAAMDDPAALLGGGAPRDDLTPTISELRMLAHLRAMPDGLRCAMKDFIAEAANQTAPSVPRGAFPRGGAPTTHGA